MRNTIDSKKRSMLQAAIGPVAMEGISSQQNVIAQSPPSTTAENSLNTLAIQNLMPERELAVTTFDSVNFYLKGDFSQKKVERYRMQGLSENLLVQALFSQCFLAVAAFDFGFTKSQIENADLDVATVLEKLKVVSFDIADVLTEKLKIFMQEHQDQTSMFPRASIGSLLMASHAVSKRSELDILKHIPGAWQFDENFVANITSRVACSL